MIDRHRIRYEEKLRQEARDDLAYQRQRHHDKAVRRLMSNQRYVDELGRDGAFWNTVLRWTAGGFAIGMVGAIGSFSEDGFLGALKSFFLMLFVFAAIGIWRGFSILRSTD